jgi:adenosylmethionine-8-amino-7-oxononanoate aminotransferase
MIDHFLHSMLVCPSWDKTFSAITHGEGVYLFDKKGNRYLDASAGSAAVANLGHGISAFADTIREQLSKVAILPTHAFSSEVVEEYLKKLCHFAPEGFERAWLANSGTEAVENSIKLALQYQQLRGEKQRYKILSRWYSYHGNSIFTLDVGGMLYRRQTYGNWMQNFPHLSPAYYYRYGNGMSEEEYCDACIQELLECIAENGPETIAAFVAEPVVGAALGAVPPPRGYFQKLRQVCDEYGIVFIADEVMTGFGRLGSNFGIERFETIPDIIASGKGVSGGYFPFSAVIVNQKVSRVFEEHKALFKAGHTFACNPVAASVGSLVIDYMEENNVLQNVTSMGALLRERLEDLRRYDIIGDVRGEGLLLGIELVKDKQTKTPFPENLHLSKRFFDEALQRGVILYPGKGSVDGLLGDHLLISPPLTVKGEEVIKIAEVLAEVIETLEKELLKKESYKTNRNKK